MSRSQQEHQALSPQVVGCAVVTVSDTRTLDTDLGGDTVVEFLTSAGHRVIDRQIVPDEPQQMIPLFEAFDAHDEIEVILVTGGTGISRRDQTCETVSRMFTKSLPGYGELFRMLSYQEIGASAMLSRATGGVLARTVLLTMPGSPAAVRLAMEQIILPELGHLVQQALK